MNTRLNTGSGVRLIMSHIIEVCTTFNQNYLFLIFLLPGKKQFPLRHGSDESCALVVNNSEILVIGGVSKPRGNIGDTTSNQTWSILPISSDVDGIHGKVHR